MIDALGPGPPLRDRRSRLRPRRRRGVRRAAGRARARGRADPRRHRRRRRGRLPEAFVTAFDALVVRGRLGAGRRVLVHAAGSGVGTAGVQIARALGAPWSAPRAPPTSSSAARRSASTTARRPRGAFTAALHKATGGRGADVVLDLVGGAYVPESFAALASRGRVIVVGLTGGSTDLDARPRAPQARRDHGRPSSERARSRRRLRPRARSRRSSGPGSRRGGCRPLVDRVLPLAEAGAAHAYVAENASFGKVLLEVGG